MRILRKAGKFARKRERNGLWRGVVTGIAAVVVFCTTYALILPAITMETEGFSCGMAEHSHTEECYQLICGQQEYFSHSHADTCYEGGQLVCGLTERVCHHHTDACYSQPQPVCGVEELPAHSHGEACYETHSILTCGVEEHPAHSHGEECYVEGELTCTLAETPGHTHGEECYQQEQTLICGKEETPGHSHTQDCYPADFEPELICGQEDIPEHRHSEACYSRICEKEEHAHTELCVDSHEAFLENQNEILNDVTEPSKADEDTPDDDGTDATEASNGMDEEEAGLEEADPELLTLVSADLGTVLAGTEGTSTQENITYTDLTSYITSITSTNTLENKVNYDGGNNVFGNIGVSMNLSFDVNRTGEGNSLPGGLHYSFTFLRDDVPIFKWLNDLGTKKPVSDKILKEDFGEYYIASSTDASGNTIFTLYLDVFPAYLAKASTQIDANINFSGSADGRYGYDNGDVVIPFLQDQSLTIDADNINYPENSTSKFDISSAKAGGRYDPDKNEISYTVTVSSQKGTPGVVDFVDTFVVKDGKELNFTAPSSVLVTDKNGNAVTVDPSITPVDKTNCTISMQLPQMAADDQYTVTYTYPVGELTEGETVKFANGVEVTSRNNDITVSDHSSVSGQAPLATTPEGRKYGWFDSATGKIQWTIEINSGSEKLDLNGKQLTDDMLANAENLTVQIDNTLNVTGDSSYYTWDGNTITFVPTADGTNDHFYRIVYYTTPSDAAAWKSDNEQKAKFNNQAVVDSDVAGAYQAEVELPSGEVWKDAGTPAVQNGKVVTEWTLWVTPSASGMPSTIEDWLDDSTDNHIVYNSVKVSYVNASNQVIEDAQPHYSVTYKQSKDGTEEQEAPRYFEILFQDDQGTAQDPFNGSSVMSNGARKLKVTYRTEATVPISGTVTYKNKVDVGGKTSEKEVSFTVTPTEAVKQGIIVGDGQTWQSGSWSSQSPMPVSNQDGKLYWAVKTTTGNPCAYNILTVQDILPSTVDLLEVYAQIHPANGSYYSSKLTLDSGKASGDITPTDGDYANTTFHFASPEGDATANTVVTNITMGDGTGTLPANMEFFVVYVCQLKEEQMVTGSALVENKATVSSGEITLADLSHTQEWTEQTEDLFADSLLKSGEWLGKYQTAKYTVTINPNGYDLDPTSNQLTLLDEFTYTPSVNYGNCTIKFALVRSSVQLYERNENGEAGNPISSDDWSWATDEDTGGTETILKIKAIIPDKKPLILKYEYEIVDRTGNIGWINLPVKNKVSLCGQPTSADGEDFSSILWNSTESGGTASTLNSITIRKLQEGNNAALLPGAEFEIEAYRDSQWTTVFTAITQYSGSGEKGCIVLKAEKDPNNRNAIIYTVTNIDENGTETKFTFEKNVLYRLHESKPPEGYLSPSEKSYISFYIQDDNDTTHTLPDASYLENAIRLDQTTTTIDITNKKETTSLSVSKIWEYDGKDVTSQMSGEAVQFKLYRKHYAQQNTSGSSNSYFTPTSTVELRYDSTIEPAFEVVKGTKVTVTVENVGEWNKPYVAYYSSHGGYEHQAIPVEASNKGDTTWTFDIPISYDCIIIVYKNNDAATVSINRSEVEYDSSQGTGQTSTLNIPDALVREEPYTLSADNHWTMQFNDLPVKGTVMVDGQEVEAWFGYYVQEVGTAYDVDYKNNQGVTNLPITILNTLPKIPQFTSITVNKQWARAEGSTDVPLNTTQITFSLYRRLVGAGAQAAEPTLLNGVDIADAVCMKNNVVLNAANQWTVTYSDLPAEDANGNAYEYIVVEDPVDGFKTSYENNEATSGTIKITNTEKAHPVMLPATGGIGWEGYTLTGLVTSIGAVLGLMKKRKKGERR
ncbi:MAG: Cna B-type domain-containing protein [Candidatus Faecousia sp.]|nr:Cna B-type domain-containing protein [Candidatus Faecousia sp.]